MRPIPLVFVATVLYVLSAVAPAAACTCAEPPEPPAAYEQADAVFEGKIDAIRVLQFDVVVDLIVERSWKGVRTARVAVRTFQSEAACGYPFRLNETYLVYATNLAAEGEPDAWRTNLCTRTRPIDHADKDLAYLSGRAIVPSDTAPWSAIKARFD